MKNRTKRLVLGEGEAIGHKHVLESKKAFEHSESENHIGFILLDEGILTHDEHDRMVFQPGRYRSYNQVEFNPMDSTVNRVFD